MMDRRAFIVGTLSLLAGTPRATAQSSRKLGYVTFAAPEHDAAFNSALRQLGWEESRNIDIRRKPYSGVASDDITAELVRLSPDVIVADTGIAIVLRRHTTTIPIVVLEMGDRLVESFARRGNVTGFHLSTLDLIAKRLQLLKEILGKPARVSALSYLWSGNSLADGEELFSQFQGLAQGLDLDMQGLRFEVRNEGELEDRFRAMASQGADAVLVSSSRFLRPHAATLTALAAKYRVPAIYGRRDPFVVAGGLMSHSFDVQDLYARGACSWTRFFAARNPPTFRSNSPRSSIW